VPDCVVSSPGVPAAAGSTARRTTLWRGPHCTSTASVPRRGCSRRRSGGPTDWASFLWTSDVPQFDYDGRWPEEDPGAFTQFSATAYASRVTTPILILHGAADLRVPTYQGREFFEALLARGKTTRMVTYPGSPHFPTLWEQLRDLGGSSWPVNTSPLVSTQTCRQSSDESPTNRMLSC